MNFRIWLIAARPPTWVASIAPLMIAGSFSSSLTSLNFFHILYLLIACLSMQIACNFTNDYFDYLNGVDDETRKGPRRLLQQKTVTPTQLKRMIWFFYSVAVLIGGYFSYLFLTDFQPMIAFVVFFFTLLSTWVSYAYTGGRYPLGYHGFGDPAAFVFFGPGLVFMLVFILIHSSSTEATSSFEHLALGFSSGFFSLLLLNLNNLRDLTNDRSKGKKTLAVLLGRKKTVLVFHLYLFLAIITPLLFISLRARPFFKPSALFLLIFVLPAWKISKTVRENKISQMNQVLKQTAVVYFFQSLLFSLLLIQG